MPAYWVVAVRIEMTGGGPSPPDVSVRVGSWNGLLAIGSWQSSWYYRSHKDILKRRVSVIGVDRHVLIDGGQWRLDPQVLRDTNTHLLPPPTGATT